MELLVILVLLVIAAGWVISRSFVQVPAEHAGLVERLGRYQRTLSAGRHLIVPILDQLQRRVDLRQTTYHPPPEPLVSADNWVVTVTVTIHLQVTDPVRATYQIADYEHAVEQLTTTTLRNVVGEIERDEVRENSRHIERVAQAVFADVEPRWGVRVDRVTVDEVAF